MSLASSKASETASSPLAPAPASPLPQTPAGATFLARLDAIRADMAAHDAAQRALYARGAGATETERQQLIADWEEFRRPQLRRHVLTNLDSLLTNTAVYAEKLDAARAAVPVDQGRIDRLQRIVALGVVDIEIYEATVANLDREIAIVNYTAYHKPAKAYRASKRDQKRQAAE